jgi:hypothetical protein
MLEHGFHPESKNVKEDGVEGSRQKNWLRSVADKRDRVRDFRV